MIFLGLKRLINLGRTKNFLGVTKKRSSKKFWGSLKICWGVSKKTGRQKIWGHMAKK